MAELWLKELIDTTGAFLTGFIGFFWDFVASLFGL